MDRPYIIAHISDLHCGSRYHIPSLATRVIDELNALEPDVVIVTGDLTDMGFRSEFRQAHRLIDQLKCENRLVLIGNHDARNVGDVHFEELFGARRRELELERGHAHAWGCPGDQRTGADQNSQLANVRTGWADHYLYLHHCQHRDGRPGSRPIYHQRQ